MRRIWPVMLTAFVVLGFVGLRLERADWDPVGLAEIGTRFSEGDPGGTEGYDGQFTYYMARELRPQNVEPRLDVPAYRYQRVLLPILGRLISFGRQSWLGWSIIFINLAAHLFGTWTITEMVHGRTGRRRYGLIYGLWVGFVVGVGSFLHEPLAFALVAAALWLRQSERLQAAALLLGLALFAKETTGLFWVAVLLIDIVHGRRRSILLLLAVGAAYFSFQLYLLSAFGSPGLGSGGAGGDPFEIVPFLGLLRIAAVDVRVFAAYLLIFGPGILLPTLWGLWKTVTDAIDRRVRLETMLLGLHAFLIVFLPFSTYREPLGLVRISCGLVIAVLVYASISRSRRVLNYSMFLPAYLALIIPSA